MRKSIDPALGGVRGALRWVASNVSLYVLAAFVYTGVLTMGIIVYHYGETVEAFGRYILVPWGMALCLLRLCGGTRGDRGPSAELVPLALLVVWMAVPFTLRFGLTLNAMSNWNWSVSIYFGVYALLTEEKAARRETLMDTACAVFLAFSLIYAGLALYSAYTVQAFWEIPGNVYGFGICDGMFLRCGVHYNITGMIAVCCAMLCLCAAARWRFAPLRVLSLLGFGMMALVVVLTQSRTARYALIGALAAGAFALVLRGGKRTLWRWVASAALGGAVLVGAYVGASLLSDGALAHYDSVRAARATAAAEALATPEPTAVPEQTPVPDASVLPDASALPDASVEPSPAIEATPETTPKPVETPEPLVPREAVDASFSGRTELWRNLFDLWRTDPWHLLIGNGPGRSGSLIIAGTMHESLSDISLHNAYLQFVADFGLVGFVLLVLFFLAICRPVLRVFFAPRGALRGELPLCMLVIACLLTGFMESAPLSGRTPMNVMLYFALGMLVAKGRELAREA